jgi:hypothetical protein
VLRQGAASQYPQRWSSAGGEDGCWHAMREAHMAGQLLPLPRPVLAVVGAAHLAGLRAALHSLQVAARVCR